MWKFSWFFLAGKPLDDSITRMVMSRQLSTGYTGGFPCGMVDAMIPAFQGRDHFDHFLLGILFGAGQEGTEKRFDGVTRFKILKNCQ
jgi:hypothetical protein